MAGDWIKIQHSTPDKPEVLEMARLLNMDRDTVVGKLVVVWTWFDLQSVDGTAPVTLRALLDRYVGHYGFCDAMENVGWLETTTEQLALPNYGYHLGDNAKKRAQSACRQAVFRNLPRNANSNADSVTREEKRREEKRSKKHTKKAPAYSEAFETWWELYPRARRTGKLLAAKAYAKAIAQLKGDHPDPDAYLLERLELFAASEWAQSKYCWGPTPWLNQGHYDDDPQAWQRKGTTDGKYETSGRYHNSDDDQDAGPRSIKV